MYGLEKSIPGLVDGGSNPAAPEPDMYCTVEHVLQEFCKQHGLKTIKPEVELVMRCEDFIFRLFYTNYTPLNLRPPEEEVEKLAEVLKVILQSNDSPRSYPDGDEGMWTWRCERVD
ncbi:hypothetical protein BD410DRAFT_789003 [Rickenella mellea]|uniref:Uncharacterized protein n=1 Tax=Rickenella mellea TaxID=50990 RepID=A0A4Y7Q4E9_9AGAM|nr:hypothetical protein BD410DRAFT_789003 [Rickenella mellea]